ncbi:MAG: hypothetical protein Q4G02_01455 [bacterium]|nr:hypothetical protein [bacterium]
MTKNKNSASTGLTVVAAIAVIALLFSLINLNHCRKQLATPKVVENPSVTYEIEGVPTTMKDGMSKVAIPDTPMSTVTTYFGQTSGDFDGNESTDTARILVQENGGSGTAYYLVVDLTTANGIVGTPGVFLGDRILIDALWTEDNEISIVFREHGENQAMYEMPEVSVEKNFTVVDGALQEVKATE